MKWLENLNETVWILSLLRNFTQINYHDARRPEVFQFAAEGKDWINGFGAQ